MMYWPILDGPRLYDSLATLARGFIPLHVVVLDTVYIKVLTCFLAKYCDRF